MILATLCYVKKEGKTLMLHRVKRDKDLHAGKWNGLGGKMNAGETPEECVIREVREEGGITIRAPHLQGVLTFPDFDGKQDWYAFVFTASEFEGEPAAECDEGKLEWVENSQLLELPLWEGDKYFLRWLDDGRFFSGKFFYKNGKFMGHEAVFHDFPPAFPKGFGF